MNKEDLQVTSINELEDGGAIINVSMSDEVYDILEQAALKEALTINELFIKMLRDHIGKDKV